MSTIITVILALMLFAFVGCGSQDESSEQSAESQTTVSVPEVDLHSAVVAGDFEAIRQHIEAGSDLNVLEPSRASTPLITAAALGKTEAAKILIDAGADLNYQNNDGSTALHTAAFFCRVEIVEALLEKGADKALKNKTGKTALEIVEIPFEDIKVVYDAIGAELRPAGVVLDYDYIEATRPKIAEMLK
ncbi:MAG: ankyrin repeat domain-containing protein [Planctomycetota bacterium]|jgi:ankyrin repeat protein